MTPQITRRRFLSIAAAAMAMPGTAYASPAAYRWRGVAFGAPASLMLAGADPSRGEAVAERMMEEIRRLEGVFSLFRTDSALSRLNRDGVLDLPAPELLEVLTLCDGLARATDGAFDPTVQPVWTLYRRCLDEDRSPRPDEIARARELIGWRQVEVSRDRILFARPGMAITLNGIAQGYATDRIAALLRAEGFTDILVHMGETRAQGRRPDGSVWKAGIAEPDGRLVRSLALSDRALATSAPLGTMIDPAGKLGHIFDPATGSPAGRHALISVSAPDAAIADGLSTAFCLMGRNAIDASIAAYPQARIEAIL